MKFVGPQVRRSLRSARQLSPHREDESNDRANQTPEKLYPSLNSENEDDQFDSSGNDSFNKSGNTSNKFSYTETYEEYRTIRRTPTNYGDNDAEDRYYRRRESVQITSLPSPSKDSSENLNKTIIWAGIFLVVAVLVYFGFRQHFITSQKIECPQFADLSKKYAHQDSRLWKSLKINIENVINQTPEQPSIFLLAYNDHHTVEQIMADIINATAQCMHSRDPIQLHGRTFANAEMLKDYGVIIDSYRERLKNEGIMYVADLHETPAEAAQAFHTICDTITPFVHKSVIFFTLLVDDSDPKISPKKVHELVEAKLNHNWDAINHDTLNALIGRVTDEVLFLHSET